MPNQNNIQEDNASINIMLEPAEKVLLGQIPSRTQTEGHSQAVSIDPRFINSIEIIDTNISVAEGGFTDGVVNAKMRSYSGQNEFGFSHRITKHSWTEFYIADDLLTKLGEGAAQRASGTPGEFHPNFDKSETSILGATLIGDFGVLTHFIEKRSEIAQKRTAVLAILEDLAYFLEVGTFTFIVGPPFVRADVINVTNSENVMGFEAGTQLFTLGGQCWAEVGLEFESCIQ